jgi:hypothetical protein
MSASIYVTAFEMLKDSIVGRIRDFFCFGFDEKGQIIDSKYESDVLRRNRSPVYASLHWLQEMGAINDEDVGTFESVKACRNHLAHELLSVLMNGLPNEFEERFRQMVGLLKKIELWWISNVEIPTNPDFDGQEIDQHGIVPGRLMTLQLLCDLALGPDEQSRAYLKEFRKRFGDKDASPGVRAHDRQDRSD